MQNLRAVRCVKIPTQPGKAASFVALKGRETVWGPSTGHSCRPPPQRGRRGGEMGSPRRGRGSPRTGSAADALPSVHQGAEGERLPRGLPGRPGRRGERGRYCFFRFFGGSVCTLHSFRKSLSALPSIDVVSPFPLRYWLTPMPSGKGLDCLGAFHMVINMEPSFIMKMSHLDSCFEMCVAFVRFQNAGVLQQEYAMGHIATSVAISRI